MRAALERLQHLPRGNDRLWILWLTSERGRPSDWASYGELRDQGEVADYSEFRKLWRSEYPEPVQWWRFRALLYDQRLYVSLGRNLDLSYGIVDRTLQGLGVDSVTDRRLLRWLADSVVREVRLAERAGSPAYRLRLERRLPHRHRLGLVLRRQIWDVLPDAYRPDRELGARAVAAFARLVGRPSPEVTHRTMTADAFFDACAIAYAANDYSQWIRPRMSPREQYRAMADGRDEGLLEVRPADPRAFARWYETRPRGGHPFEFCRGGNRTHITLGVTRLPSGWQLFLEGGSTSRMVETARMALALQRRTVPFVLHRAREMLLKLRGEDLVGIVPHDVHGAHAAELFPEEDSAFDTVTIDLIGEAWRSLERFVRWRAVEVTCDPASGTPAG